MSRFLTSAFLCLLLTGCASHAQAPSRGGGHVAALPPYVVKVAQSARLRTPGRPLQCVPYAREVSGIALRGDAWTWWQQAEGRYQRHRRPDVGSVLVLRRTQRLNGGHLAVVTEVLDERTILVSHANWLNRGRIHENIPVRDVSERNDWSLVRVWYLPGRTLGQRSYPAHGFIQPRQPSA